MIFPINKKTYVLFQGKDTSNFLFYSLYFFFCIWAAG